MATPLFSDCKSGSYCSDQAMTPVGNNKTPIYHRTVTTLTGQGPAYSGSTTETYIITKNAAGIETWALASTTTDAGKTQQFTSVAGADFRKDMVPGGDMYKNTQAQVQKTLSVGGRQQGILPLSGGSGSLDKITPQQQKQLGIIPQSTATTPEAGNTTTQSELLSNKTIADGDYRKSYDGAGGKNPLRYPLNRDKKQDYIKFSMYRYSPRKLEAGGDFGDRIGSNKDNSRSIIGCATLPIQPNISDSNQVTWGKEDINAFDATGQSIATEAMKGNAGEAVDAAGEKAKSAAPAIKELIAKNIAALATGTNKNVFTKTTGAIMNPNAELLFSGPELRGFSFTFTLSAREPAEAIQIKKIIRFFKQGMSVKRAASTLFLKSPNTFGISYIYGEKEKETDHPWINQIKECALTNFGVNYTPAGNYATYEDGSMTSYDLSMQFQELDPIYDDDYNEADNKVGGGLDSSIGY